MVLLPKSPVMGQAASKDVGCQRNLSLEVWVAGKAAAEKMSPWGTCHQGVGGWGGGMPFTRGQAMGDVEYKHPSTTAMQSLQLHTPQRRGAGVVNEVGSYVRFQRTVITGKVPSDLVVPLVFSLQLTHWCW